MQSSFFFQGGSPGARGLNLLIRADGRTINLGPKTAVAVNAGVSKIYDNVSNVCNTLLLCHYRVLSDLAVNHVSTASPWQYAQYSVQYDADVYNISFVCQ